MLCIHSGDVGFRESRSSDVKEVRVGLFLGQKCAISGSGGRIVRARSLAGSGRQRLDTLSFNTHYFSNSFSSLI